MFWLIIAILAYLSLAVVSLFDRYLLVNLVPSPKTYTFYVGIFWILTAVLFLPFGVTLPALPLFLLGLGAGAIRILAILFLAESIKRSEISRTIPAIGGFLPVFSFLIFFLYEPQSGIVNFFSILSFIILVLGSVFISLEDKKGLKGSFILNLKYPAISAFLFALNFFLTKMLFIRTSFVDGFFWPLIGGGLGAAMFLIFPQIRKSIFSQRVSQKLSGIFFLGQLSGGLGVLLQYYAVFLAKASQVPLINALEGLRYVFLLFFVFLLSRLNRNILREEVAGSGALRKTAAVFLIGLGLILIAFNSL